MVNTTNIESTYRIFVDGAKSVEELIREGDQFQDNSNINSEQFPVIEGETGEVELALFHFSQDMKREDVLMDMDSEGWKPSNSIHLLLSLGARYPELQQNFPILALNVIWENFAICLANDSFMVGRLVGFEGIDGSFKACWRYIAVRK